MRVELQPGLPGRRWACLRPINGHDELSIDPGAPGAEAHLLARLAVDPTGAPGGVAWLRSLTACDRDRLLAAVYGACFGDEVDSVAACTSCGESFRLTLSIEALLRHTEGERPEGVRGPDPAGYFEIDRTARFRLPTIGDLEETLARSESEAGAWLRERCCAGVTDDVMERVQAAMETLAPILDFDVQTRCPQCGAAQAVRFNLSAFLLRALVRERRFLTREVHRLAVSYGWGLDEILRLSRDDRRAFVQLVEAEASRGAHA